MKKIAIAMILGLFLVANFAFAQDYTWSFDKVLYDFQMPQTNTEGIHGVAVDPDGNIWLALHGAMYTEPIINPAGDTLGIYRPLFILDPDGNHVDFSPLKVLEFPDGTLDTMHTNSPINGSGKGISVDNDGNILYSSWTTVYRINYQTGMGMNVFTPDDMSSITEAVQDENGNIYVSYVLGGARPIIMLDNDFNFIGNAADTVGHINRTLAVSRDGTDLYLGSTWNGFGVEKWHSDIPGILPFEPVDTLGNWKAATVGDSVYEDVKLWPSCLDWDPDGRLWAGNLRPDWSGPKGAMYYAFDVETGMIVDSVGVPLGDSTAGGVYSPRGAAWSNDGELMYLADFDYNLVGQWKKVPVSDVKAFVNNNAPLKFQLDQNYPNPFNPSTTISFTIKEAGLVELTVYDVTGRQVKKLLEKDMATGVHKVVFDARDLASGVYYYSLKHEGLTQVKQMVLVK